jgi:hypothetical protein
VQKKVEELPPTDAPPAEASRDAAPTPANP